MSQLPVISRSAESAQDLAYRWLKKRIAALSRHQGVFLTEAEVSEATGMSRTPVREALLRLEAEGFLRIVPKKGAFVPPITDAEIREVMQARSLVEDWCVRHIAQRAASLAPELDLLLVQQERVQGSPVPFIEFDREFHRRIVQEAGNAVLVDFYESMRERQLRMGVYALAASPHRSRTVLAEHRAIVDEVRTGDPNAAAAAVAAHLANTLTALQLVAVSPWAPEAALGEGIDRR